MEDNHRTILRRNTDMIGKLLENVEEVVDYLVGTDPEIVTKKMKDNILIANKTPAAKVSALLFTLTHRGPKAFDEFYSSLVHTNNGHIADILCPEKAEMRKLLASAGRKPLPVQPPKPPNPHIQQANQNEIDGQQNYEPDFPHLNEIYSPLDVPALFNNVDRSGLDEIKDKLKVAKNVYEHDISKPLGQYLIITNKHVKCRKWTERENDKDITALQDLFEKLGYERGAKSMKNRNLKDLRDGLIKFRRDLPNPTSSLIVFIHSYGTDDGFYSYDGEVFKFEELETIFTADACPALSGKPKLFFVQSCIPKEDMAVGDAAKYVEKTDISQDSGSPATGRKADVFFFLSRTPGNLWAEQEQYQKGSWFVQAFVGILCQYSHSEKLTVLMSWVKNYVDYLKNEANKIRKSSEEINANLHTEGTMTKEFYFLLFGTEEEKDTS